MGFSIEKIMRVYDDSEGVYLQVHQNPDYPDTGLVISTNDNKKNEEWYGKVDISLNDKDQILALAKVLIEMAEMIK